MGAKFRIGQTSVFIEPTTEHAGSTGSITDPTALTSVTGAIQDIEKEKQVEFVDAVGALAMDIDGKLSELMKSTKVRQINLELSLSLSAEASIWFVKSSGKGAIKVALKWERPE